MIRTVRMSWRVQFLAILLTNTSIYLKLMHVRSVMDRARAEGAAVAEGLRESGRRMLIGWISRGWWLPLFLTILSQGFVLRALKRQLQGQFT